MDNIKKVTGYHYYKYWKGCNYLPQKKQVIVREYLIVKIYNNRIYI